jgi:antitoxin (DNA-binding transcriptional repressor) of toxin-antitoxin stability system
MPAYSIQQAKTHLSELIRMAERGETVTITRGRTPVALLVRTGATPKPMRPGAPDDAWADAPHERPVPAWTAFPWGGTVAGNAGHAAAVGDTTARCQQPDNPRARRPKIRWYDK